MKVSRRPLAIGLTAVGVAALLTSTLIDITLFLPWSIPAAVSLVVGALLTYRVPGNRIAWLLLLFGVGVSLGAAGSALAAVVGDPIASGWVEASGYAFNTAAIVFVLGDILLRFPDGQLPGRAWRWVEYYLYAGALMGAAAALFNGGFGGDVSAATVPSPLRDSAAPVGDLLSTIVTFGSLIWLICAVAPIVRYRRSTGEERLQMKWLAYAAGLLVMVSLIEGVVVMVTGDISPTSPNSWVAAINAVAFSLLPVAIAFAVLRYRLYDIDVVISRTLVYGTLALFIGVVYVAVAVAPWIVLGSEARNNAWLGIVATIVVAVSFQPMRRRMERLANRLVYGRRATPYEVLSTFSQGLSAVDPGVLRQVAKSLTEGTTADSAAIWIGTGEARHCIAAWPVQTGGCNLQSTPVVHDGEELGSVVLDIPPGQPFPVTDRRLLDQVAAGLGLALRNLQLTDDLRHRVDELAASRRRIVTVQDETRRKLERDLHDGAQQRLVALKIKLGIGSAMAEKSGLDDVKSIIDTVRDETDHTIDSVRDFARGIYPPLLEAEGLGRALSAQARRMPIPVAVQAAGLERYPKEQEATVYFCVLEALQNATKHSEATSVQVVLAEKHGDLEFEVRDDGVGFDKSQVDANGLINMMDRVEAVGGKFGVETAPGRGTTVFGTLPIAELVTA